MKKTTNQQIIESMRREIFDARWFLSGLVSAYSNRPENPILSLVADRAQATLEEMDQEVRYRHRCLEEEPPF